MSELKAIWMPYYEPRIQGRSMEIGNFWITFSGPNAFDGTGEIKIKIIAPAKGSSDYFASFSIHYDGIATMRALDECGFLKLFEETRAQTFYDVFYCLHASGVSVLSHDGDYQLVASRRMYEILTRAPQHSE